MSKLDMLLDALRKLVITVVAIGIVVLVGGAVMTAVSSKASLPAPPQMVQQLPAMPQQQRPTSWPTPYCDGDIRLPGGLICHNIPAQQYDRRYPNGVPPLGDADGSQ